MASVLSAAPPGLWGRPWMAWLPLAIGLAAVYIPSYLALSSTIWTTEENGHGPIVLGVFAWLVWRQRDVLVHGAAHPSPAAGWASLMLGLALFVLGHSQSIEALSTASHIPVLIGVLLLLRGWGAVKALWFPLVFLLFLIPIPGVLLDPITAVLKQQVSSVVENALYALGYPIGRRGVTIQIGAYQLLMADACSGLNSIFSLSALGVLYLYLMRYRSRLHVALMLISIIPIAIAANVIRVATLVLVTYYFGDEVGQGLAHGAAGMLLFVVALVLLFALDSLLRLVFRRSEGVPA
jgi:exosortase B